MQLIIKNRVQIVVHISIWILLYGLTFYPVLNDARPIPSDVFPKVIVIIILFYINYFYLVPEYLLKKSVLFYILVSLGLLAISVFLNNHFYEPKFPNNFFFNRIRPRGFMIMPYYKLFLNLGIPYVISAILRMYVEWKRNENLRLSVEKENIKSELQFLKAQLNPHFLFNSLNTIYALSVKKSPDTSEAIVDLSELMRYMIYEADKDLVPLNKEIDYIKSYIQLQRLRLSDSENVSLKITGEDRGRAVPPLMFISFIENAFKHGISQEIEVGTIQIVLQANKNEIYFEIENSKPLLKKSHSIKQYDSIGLENIRKQLEILYDKNNYTLNIKEDNDTYLVSLKLINHEI